MLFRKMEKLAQSMEIYKFIERTILEAFRVLKTEGTGIEKETDDEKFVLLKKVYSDMWSIMDKNGNPAGRR